MGNKLQLLLVLHLLVHHLHYRLQYVTCNLQLIAADSSLDYCSNAASSSCDHLGNSAAAVSDLYPFAFSSSPSAPCAFSPFFRLSNCSNSQHAAYWDAFAAPATINPNDVIISRPPAVMGISRVNSSTYINVTWDSDLISEPSKYISVCSTPPVPLTNLSHTFPPSINLTAPLYVGADSSISIPSNNVYLLFNCANSTDNYNNIDLANSYTLEASTALCQIYRDHCAITAEYYTSPCVQLSLTEGSTALLFQNAMDNLDCTHFQFFVTKTGSADTAVTEWGKAILQLQWTDPNCSKHCLPAETYLRGSCVFDSTNHTLKKCVNCTYGEGKDGFCKSGLRHGSDSAILAISIMIPIIVGASFLINIILALIYCCRRIRRRRRSVKKLSKSPACRNIGAWPQELSSGSSNESLDLNGLSERPMEYSYSSIASATSSFSSKVGEGGFGAVFKGAIHDNQGGVVQEIAVKVLEVRSKHSRKQFLNEVAIIGRIHHVNVVRLLGFCVEQRRQEEELLRHDQMLVYEYVVNGSLDTWLFNRCSKRATAGRGGAELEYGGAEKEQVQEMQAGLEWGQRYGIALGIARGLSYLHEECRHRIVHCDIKPHNILLDAAMCPKIADFGLARLMSRDESRVVTLAKGTPGYMAPEFWFGGDIHLSTKADVYSYGMVLLEIVSGRRNFAAFGCDRFPAVAFQAAMRGDFESILDVRLQLQGTLITSSSSSAVNDHADHVEEKVYLMWQQVRTAIFVALWCIQDNPTSRPYMSEVVQYLEGIAAVSEQPPLPAVACTCTCTTMTSPLAPICLNSDSHGLLLQDQTPISQGR